MNPISHKTSLTHALFPRNSSKVCWRKRGRPKLEKAKIDLGTLELQEKRKILYGSNHSEVCKSSPSLDLLYHHHSITSSQYEAGKAYYQLSQKALRVMEVRPSTKSCLAKIQEIPSFYSPWSSQSLYSKQAHHILQRWQNLERYLTAKEKQLPSLFYRIIVDQRLEKKMFLSSGIQEPIKELDQLKKGLEHLVAYFKFVSP